MEDSLDELSYSEEALACIELFFVGKELAFFYFEDAGYETFYERFIQKLFPGFGPFKVLCLGGKSQVLKKAVEKPDHNTPQFFVLDKDFDDLLGKYKDARHVFYLEKYSIENYLCDVKSILLVAMEEGLDVKSHAEAFNRIREYPRFNERLVEQLALLSRYFILAQRYQLTGLKSTKRKIDDLLRFRDGLPVPSDKWIAQYRQEFFSACVGSNEWLGYDETLDEQLHTCFSGGKDEVNNNLCGKYMLGCTLIWFDETLGLSLSKMDTIKLYTRLLNHLDMKKFDFLKDLIRKSDSGLFRAFLHE